MKIRNCTKCKEDYEDYGQRSSWCRPCKRAYDRDYHNLRSPEAKARRSKLQEKRKLGISSKYNSWKSGIGCKYCPENEAACLDLHHLNPKEKEISLGDAMGRGWTLKKLMKEAAKCIVVCSNCHRKIHAGLLKEN